MARLAAPLAALLSAAVAAAAVAAPPLKLHVLGDLLQARRELHAGSSAVLASSYGLVMETAEKNAQAAETWSVMDKNITLPGISPHNYISIGIYNHPCNAQPPGCKPYPSGHALPPGDCDNASGLPWVPCDGIRNPQAIASGDSPAQSAMVNAVSTAALAAFFSSNDTAVAQRHVAYGAKVLRKWFIDNSTMMLPNLYYGQIQPRKVPPHKSHGGFIEWAHTAMFLDHITLLQYAAGEQQSTAWTKEDSASMQVWWHDFQAYVESETAQGERRMSNNHGSWYDADWLSVALFNGDVKQAEVAAAEVKQRRISLQILSNGSEWIELERNVPSGYCQYNLQALTTCADLSMSLLLPDSDATTSMTSTGSGGSGGSSGGGSSVWDFSTEDGRSLRKAIDWLLPYAANQTRWPYKQPEAPNWKGMTHVLRRASRHYSNQSYEEALCTIFKESGDAGYWGRSELNLQLPPLFELECK